MPLFIRGSPSCRSRKCRLRASAAGEILVRVEACGICHTDLKKIEYDLLAPPRIYGHETAGVVAAVGEGVTQLRRWATGSSRSTTFPACSASTAAKSLRAVPRL